MKNDKNSSGIPAIGIIIVLVVNLIIYSFSKVGGQIFFGIFGFWFLLYGIYKITGYK